MANASSLNKNEMIKETISEHQEEGKNVVSKLQVNIIDFLSPLESFKLWLMLEAKIITVWHISKCIKGNI